MFPFKRTGCFASILLIVIVLFHILMCVDAGFKLNVIRRSRISPIMKRPIAITPVRPPVIRLGKIGVGKVQPGMPRPLAVKPPIKPPISNVGHQPFRPIVTRPPVISLSKIRPNTPNNPTVPLKATSSAMVLYKRPVMSLPGSSIKPGSSSASSSSYSPGSATHQTPVSRPSVPLKTTSSAMVLSKRPVTSPLVSSIKPGSSSASSSSHSASSATHQITVSKPSVPLKTTSSAMVLFKRPVTSPLVSSINSSSSSASSSSHSSSSATHQMTVSKPSVPLKTPLSIAKPYKSPQTSQVKLIEGQGTKLNRPSQLLITNKPTAQQHSISKITTTNVQSQSKPLSAASSSNYPAWANPYLKPQASGSGSLHSSSSPSLATKPLTSSLSSRPYKLGQNKLSHETMIKPQTSSSVSSSPDVTAADKPQINSKPHTPYQGISHPTSGSSSLIRPSKMNAVKPGTTSTSSQHHVSPINEPAHSSSHASSVMSSSNSHPHHEVASAPITSTSQTHPPYPGANHPTNAANYAPQLPPVQINNIISNGNPTQHAGSQMGHYGGSQMGHYGGLPMGGMGGMGMIAESAAQTVVNMGIYKLLNPSEGSNFNYAHVPINPDLLQQPQSPAAYPSAPAEGTSTINNNYYVDPNAANVATPIQSQTTSSQTFKTGSSPGNYGTYQNPMSTGTWNADTGNIEATNLQQPSEQPFVEQNGNLPPSDEENGNVPLLDEENGNVPPLDGENGNLPPSDEENGSLPPLNEENGNLPPSDEENGSLPALNEENGNVPPLDEENGNVPPLDEENENLPPSDEENGSLPPLNEENGNVPPLDEENGNRAPLDKENGNQPPLNEENGNLTPLDEENGNVLPLDEGNGNQLTLVEVAPVDNSALWEVTETIFGYEVNISRYIKLDLQASEFDSVAAIEATKPLINVQKEAKLFPTVKALSDLFDNYEDDPTKTENMDAEEEDALLDAFLKTDAMIIVMKFLEDCNYIAPDQWMETLQQLWMRRYENSMSGFERIFLAEKNSEPTIFGGQNWIYFDHQEQSKRIKYTNYQNSLNIADMAQLVKVNYQFDNVDQKSKAMLVGTSPHLEMALYTLCHYVRGNDWCTVSLAGTKFGIYTHSWIYEGTEMLDTGHIAF